MRWKSGLRDRDEIIGREWVIEVVSVDVRELGKRVCWLGDRVSVRVGWESVSVGWVRKCEGGVGQWDDRVG